MHAQAGTQGIFHPHLLLATGEELRAKSESFVKANPALNLRTPTHHFECRNGVLAGHGQHLKRLFGIVLQGLARVGRSAEESYIQLVMLLEHPGHNRRGFGQEAGIVISIHDQVGRGLVECQVAVGRESLAFIFIDGNVSARGQTRGYEVEITLIGILVGDNIPDVLLLGEQHVLNTYYSFV